MSLGHIYSRALNIRIPKRIMIIKYDFFYVMHAQFAGLSYSKNKEHELNCTLTFFSI